VDEVGRAIGRDSRIGPKFLKASVGFGGSCFQKDILNLSYLCEHFGLPEVAAYWQSVVKINDWQKSRFSHRMVKDLFNTVTDKHLAILGFAFKKDTNDTRETAAIAICRDLLAEGAKVYLYDPQVSEAQIRADVLGTTENPNLIVVKNAIEACHGAHAVAILTEWDEFRDLDFQKIYQGMLKPAFLFDGRNILPHTQLKEIGFQVFAIGKQIEN
jgi:UDPglucose 6-dehydrogenase